MFGILGYIISVIGCISIFLMYRFVDKKPPHNQQKKSEDPRKSVFAWNLCPNSNWMKFNRGIMTNEANIKYLQKLFKHQWKTRAMGFTNFYLKWSPSHLSGKSVQKHKICIIIKTSYKSIKI